MNNVVTRRDIKKLSTKTELKKVEKTLRQDILRVEERVENIEERLENIEEKAEALEEGQNRLETKIDKVLNTVISFVGRVENLETENEVGAHQIRELESSQQAA